MESTTTRTCDKCAGACVAEGCAAGYATTDKGETLCYSCAADRERAWMKEHGRTMLYDAGGEVTDWPGRLRFRVDHRRIGRHNIARKRYDVWFIGPDGCRWHGVRFGDNTQIVHCKRVK